MSISFCAIYCTLSHFAYQIAANELARALLERDPETSCEIIRLLLASE